MWVEPAGFSINHANERHDRKAAAEARAHPLLSTAEFDFRPFALSDIEALAALAGEHRIADTTIGIPHPYTADFARNWITAHAEDWNLQRGIHWAVSLRGDGKLAGYVALVAIDREREQAELRFWVGRGVERRKHGVEWSEKVLEFATEVLRLRRIYALQLKRHTLAGHILTAIGMSPQGIANKRAYKDGPMEEMLCWATRGDDPQPR